MNPSPQINQRQDSKTSTAILACCALNLFIFKSPHSPPSFTTLQTQVAVKICSQHYTKTNKQKQNKIAKQE
ncbi:hypothetical protein SKAU_G00017610 [Synaphobranchus kaupii]|uniref:Uncharacterized protein n=1 Tax=Synaphobranchus kaupii TaxID=118154 RepID=A0A9Q1JCT4_SYNKA|nr:hypothetical protein SKAU_G00017610 [Synaphobranchus kaupii]